jgi:ketosteroid isomerase-like protein
MDRSVVERWMASYRRAWASDAPDDIAALFTEDVRYAPYPWPRGTRAWQGRDLVVKKWIERGDSGAGWRFDHEIVAVDGDTAVIEGWTYYDPTDETPYEDAYANIWIVRFAADGRARQFDEWWVQRRRPDDGATG